MIEDIRKYWLIRVLLYPISVLYGIITDLRNFLYSSRIFKVQNFDVPTISIGNIVAGGTGKTPFTMLCIDLLKDQYQRIVVVSRGYGRKSKGLQVVSDGNGKIVPVEIGGDEPVMIARKYPQIPVIVAETRTEGVNRAIDTFKSDLILLDDAFQHRQVSRNCDLVIINSGRILSREKLLPLGDLRERLTHLNRADLVILNKSQRNPDNRDRDLLNKIFKGPVFDCFFRPTALVNSKLEKIGDISVLKDKPIYVFCAIGGPEKFIRMLTELGAKIQNSHIYPDHHNYTVSDFEQIIKEYQTSNSHYLITTEKDMVKIDSTKFKDLDLVAVSLTGEVDNVKTFVDKLNQFIDIKN